MFRVWVVATVLWAIGCLAWVIYICGEDFERLLRFYCDPSFGDYQYAECYALQSEKRDKQFWSLLKSPMPVVVSVPPILVLAVGVVSAKIVRWVGRGFDS